MRKRKLKTRSEDREKKARRKKWGERGGEEKKKEKAHGIPIAQKIRGQEGYVKMYYSMSVLCKSELPEIINLKKRGFYFKTGP